MMSPTIMVLIVIMLILCARFLYKKSLSNPHPLPPGPMCFPFIGCTIHMLLNKPTFRWIHNLMDKFNTQILCIRLGCSTHVITVTSPELACEFLKKQDAIFISRPDFFSAYLLSDGYHTAALAPLGDQWRKMRRIITHDMLSSQVHKWFQPKRDEESNQLLGYICNQIQNGDNITDGGLINIRMVSRHFCGNLMRNMIFGRRFFGKGSEDGGPGEEETEHVAAIFNILKYLYAFCITDYHPWLRGKTDFDGHEKSMRSALKIARKYQDPLINERIQMWKNGDRMEKHDLLDVLIQHDNPKVTIVEIKAQIIEIMGATVDNPSNAVEWTMGEMMNEPTLLKRAVEELDHVVGCNRLVQEQDLPQLNYLKACIKEAFRLHPFAAFNPPHVSTMDTTVAGYFIPKGSHVLLSRRGLGRNPNVWTDPLRFNPDRHLQGEEKQVVLTDDELRMISFSTGKRGCPAVVLGSTITTIMLARMLQGFTWEPICKEVPINLDENHDDLSLAKPLVLIAKPRLPQHLYPNI
ncbi:valine N-monooxygenase 1 [Lactuca sativa]|nr:valine N-monooxygenase 1 [Lactuca sativa]